jgi:hypothetical protein
MPRDPRAAPLKRKKISHGFEAFMDFQASESSILGLNNRPQSLGDLNPWAQRLGAGLAHQPETGLPAGRRTLRSALQPRIEVR